MLYRGPFTVTAAGSLRVYDMLNTAIAVACWELQEQVVRECVAGEFDDPNAALVEVHDADGKVVEWDSADIDFDAAWEDLD